MAFSFCSQAEIVEYDTVEWNGHLYTLIGSGTVYEIADYADTKNGYVVSINSQEENDFIVDTWSSIGSSPNAYITASLLIGANDAMTEGVWAWDSGETFSYDNWRGAEPNDGGDYGEDYAIMYLQEDPDLLGQWNDVSDLYNRISIVEVEMLSLVDVNTPLAFGAFLLAWLFGRRTLTEKQDR